MLDIQLFICYFQIYAVVFFKKSCSFGISVTGISHDLYSKANETYVQVTHRDWRVID